MDEIRELAQINGWSFSFFAYFILLYKFGDGGLLTNGFEWTASNMGIFSLFDFE